jgi:hypothetical protein
MGNKNSQFSLHFLTLSAAPQPLLLLSIYTILLMINSWVPPFLMSIARIEHEEEKNSKGKHKKEFFFLFYVLSEKRHEMIVQFFFSVVSFVNYICLLFN